MLKIGDRVKFISDTGVGIVTKIDKNIVWVEVEDGFEMPSDISDIVQVSKEDELEALERIGQGDDRPGSKRAKHNSKSEKSEVKKDKEVYRRYGKVSLVSDEDMEDGEEMLDLFEIKERYVKNLLAVQQREKEINQEDKQREDDRKGVFSEMAIVEDVFAPKEPVQPKADKMIPVTLGQLAKIESDKSDKKTTIGSVVKKEKKENDEIEVIDLHAHEVLESTKDLSNGEIITAQLGRFTISLDTHINNAKHGRIIYIHGVGKGRLRYEIERKLKLSYPKVSFQDASFQEYGYGAILLIW